MRNFNTFTAFIFIVFFVCSIKSYGITCVCTASGDWNNPATWSPNGVPACGDSIAIPSNYTVTITNQLNYNSCSSPMKIAIYGSLKFVNGNKLSLPCGSYVWVAPSGTISSDQGNANSNLIEICNVTQWNSNNSPMTGPACYPCSHPVCGGCPLPVELISFNVTSCNSNVCINWATAIEIDNDYFEIERSDDAINFMSIFIRDSKAPLGNSYSTISYEGVDEAPLSGTGYYRLKQIDKDRSFTYSKILAFRYDPLAGMEFSVFPNMNSGEFTAQLKGLKKPGIVVVLLRSATGVIVYKAWQYINGSGGQINMAPEWKLPNGIYFCSFLIEEAEYVEKIVVGN
jgi:hypothetical protein